MKHVLLIGIGGFVGSVLRYGVHVGTREWFGIFPVGTLLVNYLGCLLIGVVTGLAVKPEQPAYFLLVTGFCGGFTTFSTFALDGQILLKHGQWGPFVGYAVMSVVGGLLLCLLGIWLGNKIVS
jgi:CrcB protein